MHKLVPDTEQALMYEPGSHIVSSGALATLSGAIQLRRLEICFSKLQTHSVPHVHPARNHRLDFDPYQMLKAIVPSSAA